jgi:NAD(P)-dependent dehydrogenase (short-subunit alcohol dehydrogenase family)
MTNKVALITGARTGIGKSTGELFAKQGYRVIFSGRVQGDCEDTVNDLSAMGFQVKELAIDLTDISSLKKSVGKAASLWGELDLLVNNGAIIDPISTFGNIDDTSLEKSTKINLIAPTLIISYCWQYLAKNKGKILNILSGASTNPIEGWAAYCSTKAGLHMVNKQAHLEGLVSNIKSIGISPGMVDTNMQKKIRESRINQISQVKKDDLLSRDTPAKFTLWCASDNANEFSGMMIAASDPVVKRKYIDWINKN